MSKFDPAPSEILPDREIDVSINTCLWIITIPIVHFGFCPYKTILELDGEEVTKTDVMICGTTKSKRPYGELGSVEKSKFCCFVSMKSSFGDICPGWGCSGALVEDLVEDLKKRQRGRGDTAQIKRAEQTIERLDMLENKIDLILNHLNIDAPSPATQTMGDRE